MKKHSRLSLPIVASLLLILVACGKKQGTVRVAGYEIDSVVIDTTVALTTQEGAPTCQLSLHLHYLKEDKAQGLNDTLLRAGILLPDYFSLSKEKLTVKELADSFVGRYLEEYLTEYAPLYRSDQEHATAYNVEYRVHTRFQESANGVLTNLADVYSYGGGAHGITADVKDNRVPVHRKSGLDFRRKRERLDAGVCEVRRDQADFLHLHLLAALGQAEVGVHHVQVQQFGALTALCRPKCKVQRQF